MTLAKVFPKVKCSNSSGIASLLTLRHGQGDCRKTSSLPRVCAKRLTSANSMKADGKQEGQSGLPGRRWSVAKAMCISCFFSLCQRIPSPSKLAVSQLWRWAEGEGWAAAPSPLGGGKEPTGCSFLMVGGCAAGQRRGDA